MGKAHEGWELTRFLRTGSNFRGVLAQRYIHGGVVSGIIASGIELAPDGPVCQDSGRPDSVGELVVRGRAAVGQTASTDGGKCSGSRRSMKQHIVQPAARSLPPAGFSKEVGWGGVSLASSSLSRHIETTDNGMR